MSSGSTQPATLEPGKNYKGQAIASLICAVVGILLFGLILGVIAIVLGASARKKMRSIDNFEGAGLALAGIILGALDIAAWAIIILLAIAGR